jgi:DNA invertase Pin-like site-specific DNA recombinase
MKYYIYARKSTDEDDRQIMSIESQIIELQEFALRENLHVIKEFIESKTAKSPGRPIFNEMISKIENSNEEIGILAWHPDRLARNSVDGGKIIYLVDENKIRALKFPTFWFENTPQGKFMLNIAFGQSKYYVDNLSENIKRGIRQKLRKGEYPGLAPVGYLNELRTHTIVQDPERADTVKKMFSEYSEGTKSLKYLQELSFSLGLVSRRTNKPLSLSRIERLLKNPFYYGVFCINGELYEGQHSPLISKKLYDEVQEVIANRGKPKTYKEENKFSFLNLFTCGECGRSITAEKKVKPSGKIYVYYRCTKKNSVCSQKYIEQKDLVKQLNEIFNSVSLSADWYDKFITRWRTEYEEASICSSSSARDFKHEIQKIDEKLNKLLNAYLDETITKEEYSKMKETLLNDKIQLKEKSKVTGGSELAWLERFRDWLILAHQAVCIANDENLDEKRSFLQKIGSNFQVRGQKVSLEFKKSWLVTSHRTMFTEWSG